MRIAFRFQGFLQTTEEILPLKSINLLICLATVLPLEKETKLSQWDELVPSASKAITVTDNKVESKWSQVSKNNYYGWYDKRLEKTDEHLDKWNVAIALNGERSDVSGYFKSLASPAKRTLVTVDNLSSPIADLSAMVIPGAERAIRVSYEGDHHMVVLDEYQSPMLRFSPKGVEVNTLSKGWQALGRAPAKSDTQWIKVSSQAAYTWPDSRLEQQGEDGWRIPVFCHQDKKVKHI